MADEIPRDPLDVAALYEQKDREAALASVPAKAATMQGPARCQCGAPNDRRREGWALCSDCQAEMETAERIRSE